MSLSILTGSGPIVFRPSVHAVAQLLVTYLGIKLIESFPYALASTPRTLEHESIAAYNDSQNHLFDFCCNLAYKGDPHFQSELGVMYHQGIGTNQDYYKAMEWLLKAYNNGVNEAAGWIADLYENGHGVPLDYAKALRWYQADNDSNRKQAFILSLAEKVPRDTPEALKIFLAISQFTEHVPDYIYHELGVMYYQGQGAEQDYQQAMKWFFKSYDHGIVESAGWIGYMYGYGYGVSPNSTQAIQWLDKDTETVVIDKIQHCLSMGIYYISEADDRLVSHSDADAYFTKAISLGDSLPNDMVIIRDTTHDSYDYTISDRFIIGLFGCLLMATIIPAYLYFFHQTKPSDTDPNLSNVQYPRSRNRSNVRKAANRLKKKANQSQKPSHNQTPLYQTLEAQRPDEFQTTLDNFEKSLSQHPQESKKSKI